MRTLGLIGGMSAESTTVYYQTLNRLVRERLGVLAPLYFIALSATYLHDRG